MLQVSNFELLLQPLSFVLNLLSFVLPDRPFLLGPGQAPTGPSREESPPSSTTSTEDAQNERRFQFFGSSQPTYSSSTPPESPPPAFTPTPAPAPAPTPTPSSHFSKPFLRVVEWTFQDISMLVGSNLPIFGDDKHPAVSLRLTDASKPVNILTGIDYWYYPHSPLFPLFPALSIFFHSFLGSTI